MRWDARRLLVITLWAVAPLLALATAATAAAPPAPPAPARAAGSAPRAVDESAARDQQPKRQSDAAEAPPSDEEPATELATPPASEPAANPADPPAESPAEPSAAVEHDPSASEPASEPAVPTLEAPSFKGVQPGTTTRDELHGRWRNPVKTERIPGGTRETYDSDAFEYVRVTILEGVVASVALRFQQPLAVETVVEQLRLADVEPVSVFDDDGRPLGQAYPEKGMLFGFVPQSETPRVFQIAIEPIDAQQFIARAEARLPTNYGGCLADARQALALLPENDRALWLCAEALSRGGDFEQAAVSVEKAIALAPNEFEYRLTFSKILSETGDHRQAIQQARDVIEAPAVAPLTQAKGYCRWGDAVAAAPERDFREAIEHHQRAVELAKPLARAGKSALRRAAKEVLLDAYLGSAHDIGHGRWQYQSTVVPKWLDRALAVADDIIAAEHGDAEVRLRVFEQALAALSGIGEPPDAARWIQGATDLGAVVVRQAADPAHKAHVAWRLGVALGDATEIEAARGAPEQALQLGKLAMAYFEQGEPAAKNLPTHDYLRGWLCFRMGAILVAERSEHKQAMGWFARAVPLLESPAPASAAVNPGRHGETFVSMAVSYWELGERKEALRLTEQGLKLMERASADGQMAAAALAVPYANLSRMHELLGDARQAKTYADMATRASAMARP